MLGARSEAEEGQRDLFELLRAASEGWAAFARDLASDAAADPGHRVTGAVAVASRPEHVGVLRRRSQLLTGWGAGAEWLTGSGLRALEPGLGPAVAGGFALPDEHQVEPRALVRALRDAATRRGARIRRGSAVSVMRGAAGRPTGLLDAAGGEHPAAAVVIAAGYDSSAVGPGVAVRPVKGQIVRLKAAAGEPPPIARTVRTPSVYLAPRDGEVVVGATSEERGDLTVTATGVHGLIEEALRVVPELGELRFAEAAAGLRPATHDGLPVIGAAPDGVIWATGGYRNGVLLTPLAARGAADACRGADPAGWARDLGPRPPREGTLRC
jgi:glycine oxidase